VASKGATHIKVGLIGRHNVYNILAASAWGISEGIGLPILKSALEKFCQVPGRLERISLNSRLSVFVDYAHTEDALRNAINALRPLTKSKIIVVFGCGGERDKDKRPKMGRVVCDLADFAFITSDNPRCEDPEDIINEIKAGIRKDNYSVIPDRRQAIGAALKMAGSDDIVLVAGKGHENYQILKDKRISFDDREVVRECLRSMNY
jgi:UDP-N-acetylmuramyl-tripeptide synthetase